MSDKGNHSWITNTANHINMRKINRQFYMDGTLTFKDMKWMFVELSQEISWISFKISFIEHNFY